MSEKTTMTPAEALAACAKFEQMAAAEVPFAECMEAAIGAALATIAANRHEALAALDSAIDCCSRSPRPCEQARAAVAALVARHDSLLTVRETLKRECEALKAERDALLEARTLLDEIFAAYENGTDCYEDPEEQAGYVGRAFCMDDATFDRCVALLNQTDALAGASDV